MDIDVRCAPLFYIILHYRRLIILSSAYVFFKEIFKRFFEVFYLFIRIWSIFFPNLFGCEFQMQRTTLSPKTTFNSLLNDSGLKVKLGKVFENMLLLTSVIALIQKQFRPRKASELATNNCEFILHLSFSVWFVIEVVLSCLHHGIHSDFVDDGIRSFIGRPASSLFSITIRRLTPSITFWTSSTSEKPSLSRFEMSKTLPLAAVSTPPVE